LKNCVLGAEPGLRSRPPLASGGWELQTPISTW